MKSRSTFSPLLASVVSLCTCILLLACSTTTGAEKPNIVLILADDLGYGDLGCFGQKVLETPRLDAMAKQGMRFTQFYAGSTVCAPSRSVLLTGRHTGHTVVRGNSTSPIGIQPGHPTLASVLKQAGYATACIGKWGVGTPGNYTNPNDVGFEHFFGYVNMWHAHNFYPEFLIRNGKVVQLENVVAEEWRPFQNLEHPMAGQGVATKRVQYAPDLFTEDCLRFIRENHEKPFFLFYSMNIPHANNQAGNEGMEVPDVGDFATREWPAAEKGFATMIRNIDRDTGRILDLLNELNIDDNTLVMFTSDNGPHREGGHDPEFFDSNGKFRGLKRDTCTKGAFAFPPLCVGPPKWRPAASLIGPGTLAISCPPRQSSPAWSPRPRSIATASPPRSVATWSQRPGNVIPTCIGNSTKEKPGKQCGLANGRRYVLPCILARLNCTTCPGISMRITTMRRAGQI